MASAEVALPTQLSENVSTVKARSWTSPLPERYVYPASMFGSIDGKYPETTLPVLDLKGLSTGDPAARKVLTNQIGNAASKIGFFQVVNHGIPEGTFDKVYEQARDFFELPVDVKEKAIDPVDMTVGYNGRFGHKSQEVPWLERLSQNYRPKPNWKALTDKIWPEGNPHLCKVVDEFAESVESVGKQLLELLAESLGLKTDFFSKEFEDPAKYDSVFRMQHYPVCPEPSRCMGSPAHSDTGVLTIVRQDAVGGFQIHDGKGFVDVTPIPGALIVNIGDTLQVWSNGRFQSCDHRVLVNGKSDRISLVYSFETRHDFVIQCPPELVDDEHPSLYIPYTYPEYRNSYLKEVFNSKVGKNISLAYALRK
ncbi:unnamed protein product [Calypogeia fissa]